MKKYCISLIVMLFIALILSYLFDQISIDTFCISSSVFFSTLLIIGIFAKSDDKKDKK